VTPALIRRDYISVGVLSLTLVVLLVGAFLAFQKTQVLPPATCTLDLHGLPVADADKGLPNHLFVVLGFVAILTGHVFGRFRNTRWYRLIYAQGPRAFDAHNRALFTLAMAIVFIGVFCALFYEALGVLRVPQGTILQPITYYVRCAIHYDMHPNPAVPSETEFPLLTVLLVVSFCFLFGHWLWYPRSRREEP
jgi:hypothetical protein